MMRVSSRFAQGLLTGLLLATATFTALAADRREHAPHEHGHGAMGIAVDGNELAINLRLPAINVVGFEHAPSTPEQRERHHKATESFKQPERLLRPSAAAECHVEKVTVAWEGAMAGGGDHDHEKHDHGKDKHDHAKHEHEHEHEHDHDKDKHDHAKHEHDHDKDKHDHAKHDHDESHSELHADYHFHCDNPKALEALEVLVFDSAKDLEELDVSVLTAQRQGAVSLTPGQRTVTLGE